MKKITLSFVALMLAKFGFANSITDSQTLDQEMDLAPCYAAVQSDCGLIITDRSCAEVASWTQAERIAWVKGVKDAACPKDDFIEDIE